MKALITGAGGMLGTAVSAELERCGISDVAESGSDIDLTDLDEAKRKFLSVKPDVIFHCAAAVRGLGGNAGRQGEMLLSNARINMNVIEAARLAEVGKLVCMGTVAVYSDECTLPATVDQIWLGEPHSSEYGYAQAKRFMYAHLEASRRQYGTDYVYCVLTNLYGPHDRFSTETGHVIPSLVAKFHTALTDGVPVPVWGSGKAERDFLFVEDAARAVVQVSRQYSGAVNIASGVSIPISEVVRQLERIVPTAQVVWQPDKPDGQVRRSYDVAQIRSLGWAPQVSLEAGLRRTFEWYASNLPAVRVN